MFVSSTPTSLVVSGSGCPKLGHETVNSSNVEIPAVLKLDIAWSEVKYILDASEFKSSTICFQLSLSTFLVCPFLIIVIGLPI